MDIDFEYIPPEDAESYTSFIREVRARLEPLGKIVMVALAPKTSAGQRGLLYEAHDYQMLGEAADYVLLMTYEWGYALSEPMAVAPINKIEPVVRFATSVIPPAKIFMGIPNYGYVWPLPYIKGQTRARSLGNVQAVEQAIQVGAPIQFDETALQLLARPCRARGLVRGRPFDPHQACAGRRIPAARHQHLEYHAVLSPALAGAQQPL